MKRLSLLVAFLFVAGAAAAATTSTTTHSTTHHKTTVSKAHAEKAALAAVPGGKVVEGEKEKEHGKLVYSFDIEVPGQAGVEEVMVDAHTGKVVSKSHESAKKESSEKAKEAKEAKTDTSKMSH